MAESVNFYELKTQLADLGYKEPAIVDQLCEAMYSDYDYASLYTDRGPTRTHINLDKDHRGDLQFHTYDTIPSSGGQLRDQVFASDEPVQEAVQLLNNRLGRPDVTSDIAGSAMNRQHVHVSLGLGPNEENIHQLNL